MSRIRQVGGTYIKKVGGDYNMYASDTINFTAAKTVTEEGVEAGESYTNQPKMPPVVNPFFEDGWWSLDEEGEKRITRAIPGMQVFFHIQTKNIPDGSIVYMELYDDDINEPEEKNEDDHIQLNRQDTGKRVFYVEVKKGKIVRNITLIHLDSFINNEADKCIELYFRCSYKDTHVELPHKPKDYLVVGALVIDRYKMPGLNGGGTDIASDMTFGKGVKGEVPVYSKQLVNQYIKEYATAGFNEDKHFSFSNEGSSLKALYSKAEMYQVMAVGNYHSGEDLKNYNEGKSPITGKIRDDEYLFWDFRNTAGLYFARGELQGNLDRMIDKFKRNEGGIYEDEVLTRNVAAHANTQNYCYYMENYIAERLKKDYLRLEKVEDKDPEFESDLDLRKSKGKIKGNDITENKTGEPVLLTRPMYSYNDGLLEASKGLTIALNDIWATEVIIKELKFEGESYQGKYQITLWDHFGLDLPDMQKKFNTYPSVKEAFICWFVLQHLRGYKPFLTKITFERQFSGNLQEGREERRNKKKAGEREKVEKWVKEEQRKIRMEPKF